MKITDKTEQNTVDPVVELGDILKREHSVLGIDYFIVGGISDGCVLISLHNGNTYTSKHIPANSTLRYYSDMVFVGINSGAITHIPADKAELVIGG